MNLAGLSPNKSAAGDDEQWAPLSDLMAALMLIFMFIAILFVRTIVQSEETYKAECDKILASFETEFNSDFKRWDVELLNDLTIRFRNPDILFESGRADVRPHFLAILQSFFPRYLSIARHHDQTDDEVRRSASKATPPALGWARRVRMTPTSKTWLSRKTGPGLFCSSPWTFHWHHALRSGPSRSSPQTACLPASWS